MKAMIIGSGLTGLSLSDYFAKHRIDYFFAKQSDIDLKIFDENYLNKILAGVDICLISPGVNPQNELIFQIKKRKIALFSELEYAASLMKNDIIAVTGTNGKTTTVSLINYIFSHLEDGCLFGGNIGIPAISLVDKIKGKEKVVLECSSFQLETCKKFAPHIAVILNITEDHMNSHKTMKEYIRCKYKITKNQKKSDYLILNADDNVLKNNPPKSRAQIFYFSIKQKVRGCYVKNKSIYFNNGETEVRLLPLSKIKLIGEHNLSNVLASVLAIYLETRNIEILNCVSGFTGVPHRIEFVRRLNDVDFYNDSKATNIASVIVALKSFKSNINLILGGSDKGYEFDELFKTISDNVKNIAVIGETRNKIMAAANRQNFKNIFICDNLEEATKKLYKLSKKGDIILLSPACASFDQFSNYEMRGNCFKKIVNSLK